MMSTEQDVRRDAVVVVGFLLLGLIGCAATVDRKAAPAGSEEAAPAAATYAEPVAETLAPEGPDPALAALTGEATGSTPDGGETSLAEPYLRIHEVRLTEREGRRALAVRLSRPPDDLRHFALEAPSRIVLDLDGPILVVSRLQSYPVGSGEVVRVRVGEHDDKLRIVADLSAAVPGYEVERGERAVTVLLGPADGAAAADEIVYVAPGIGPDGEAALAGSEGSELETEEAAGVAAGAAGTAAPGASAPAWDAAGGAGAATDPPAAIAEAALAEPEGEPIDPIATGPAPETAGTAATGPEPEAYLLPVREARRRDAGPRVATIEGGTITATPRLGAAGEYTGQRISLDFKDADIQNVLRILADVSGLNIITTEDVAGRLTMRLMDVPWDQALEAILKAQGLDMVRDGNIIRISTVGKLKEERDALRLADEAQKQAEPLKVRYIRVNYAKADKKLVEKVQEVLTERGSATWDERTNTIVVRDIARGIADAEELVAEFDTQTPQVLIEANIVEATDAFVRDLGIQWGYTYRASPETGNAPGVNFPGRVRAGGIGGGSSSLPAGPVPFIADFPANIAGGGGSAYDIFLGSLDGSSSLSARLTALESEGKGKIISRPRVVTLNNVPATIESLRIVRVRLPSTGTVISTGAGGAAGGATNATEQIRTGIILKVTPQVSSDGYVFLDVKAKSSTLEQTSSPEDGIPDEVSREANSHVLIQDGETFVLGGVFRNELSQLSRGVPFLRSLPVLGWAFRNDLNDNNRQELLVFITPRVVRARGTEDLASLPSAASLWQHRAEP